MYDLHGTECYFVHKRLIRAIGGGLTGGIGGAVGGFFQPSVPRPQRPTGAKFGSEELQFADPSFVRGIRAGTITASAADARCGAPLVRNRTTGRCTAVGGFAPSGPCGPLQRPDGFGGCLDLTPGVTTPAEVSVGRGGIGQAVMGRYGAAYVPGSKIINRAICLPGDVVGDDGLCYPKRSLRNSDREWPRGRRPLLTGGEMRAISVAHRAAGRLTRTAVRLQDMGLIKKPVARKPPKKKG